VGDCSKRTDAGKEGNSKTKMVIPKCKLLAAIENADSITKLSH
jgi:hypothetical protein